MTKSRFALRSSPHLLLGAAWLAGLALSGCELIASVDRSKIEGGGGGGAGGTDNAEAARSGTGATGMGATGGVAGDGSSGGESGMGAAAAMGGTPNGAAGAGGDLGAGAAMGEMGGAPGMGGVGGEVIAAGAGAGGGPAVRLVKMIYVTSVPKKANFGGVSAADTLCNAAKPEKAPANATFKALLADGTTRFACESANCATEQATNSDHWVLKPSTTYVRDDDATVIGTTTAAAIFTFPLEASIGTQGLSYWTGLNADWTTSSDNCTGWTATLDVSANVGLDNTTDDQALAGAVDSCQSLAGNFFACVEQ